MVRIECQTSLVLVSVAKENVTKSMTSALPFLGGKEYKNLAGERSAPGAAAPICSLLVFPFVLISMFQIFSLCLAVVSLKMSFTWQHPNQEKENI